MVRQRRDALRAVRLSAPRAARSSPTRYPADFICEAIDQTRGWFYTLMAVGTLVFEQSSYKTVLCLGHILDEEGRKMSKHLGNVLEPIPLMDQHGADAVRWFMLAGGSPWQARRVGHSHDPGGRAQDAADLLEHRVVPGALRARVRLRPEHHARSPGRRALGARPVGAVGGAPPRARRRRRRSRRTTPRRRAGCCRRTSTTCRTGTCAGRVAASGPATPRRSRRCTSASTS